MAEPKKRIPNLQVENATIVSRNFAGAEKRYNPKGNRNFLLMLTEDMRADLEREGWNVKYLMPRLNENGEQVNPDDEPRPFIKVFVRFDNFPPKILLISGEGKTVLDEESARVLDYAEIESIDLIINPSVWAVEDKTGIKPYLKTAYVKLREDDFAKKYYDVPEAGDGSAGRVMSMGDEPDWSER